MRAPLVQVLFLFACTPQALGFTFPSHNNWLFPTPQPQLWRCLANDGSQGVCMSLISGGCPLYRTTAHLMTRRPNICALSHRDAIVCCPVAVLGPVRGVVPQPPPTTHRTTPAPFRITWPPFASFRTTQSPFRSTQPPTRTTQPPFMPIRTSGRPTVAPPPLTTRPPLERITSPTPPTRPPNRLTTPQLTTPQPQLTSPPAPVSSTRDLNRPIGLRPRPSLAPIVETPRSRAPREFRQPNCGLRNPIEAFRSGDRYLPRRPAFAPSTRVMLGMHPWAAMVGLQEPGSSEEARWVCAGALLAPRIVLTSAQCVMSAGHPDDLLVGLGEHDLTSVTDGQAGTHRVLAVEFHPEWSQPQRRHSLAVLLLNRPADSSPLIQPVCLPPPDLAPGLTPLPPVAGSVVAEVAYDLDSTGMQDASARQRLEATSARVEPFRACAAALEDLPLTEFLFPGGPQPEPDLCLVTGDNCALDVGAPVVAEGQDGTAQLEGLELLDSCAPNRPRLLLRVRHYVPFIAGAIEKLMKSVNA